MEQQLPEVTDSPIGPPPEFQTLMSILRRQFPIGVLKRTLKKTPKSSSSFFLGQMMMAHYERNPIKVLRLGGSFEFKNESEKATAEVILNESCKYLIERGYLENTTSPTPPNMDVTGLFDVPQQYSYLPRELLNELRTHFFRNNGEVTEEDATMFALKYQVEPRRVTSYFKKKKNRFLRMKRTCNNSNNNNNNEDNP